MLARLVGDIGVATFSVLSFIYSLANAILSGVAQGLQPLWGQGYGRKDTIDMRWYFRSGLLINLALSVLIYGGLFFFDVPVIKIFNKEPSCSHSPPLRCARQTGWSIDKETPVCDVFYRLS